MRRSRKQSAIRWKIEAAAAEFPINPRTLSSRLKRLGIEAGSDHCWSTAQICEAVFGGIENEKLRKITAEADVVEIRRDELRGSMIPVERVGKVIDNTVIAIRQVVKGSGLSDAEKESCMRSIRGIDVESILEGGGEETAEGELRAGDIAQADDRGRVGKRAPLAKSRKQQSKRKVGKPALPG